MALLQHLLAILLATWTFHSAVDCLAVPTTTDSYANNSTTQQKNNVTTMPGEIVLTLTTQNETITLNLTRNTNIPSDVPVVIAANGTQTTWKQNSDQFAVYYEMNSSASIVIEMKNENGQLIKSCRGTLSINGNYYSVLPVEHNYGNDSGEEFLVDIDGVAHVMRVEDIELDFADLINSSSSQRKYQSRVNATDMFDSLSGFQRYVVEMAIFVDYALYYRWLSRTQGHWDAIYNIYYYFVQVANGVDMRYSTIALQTSDFSINVRLVGIYIATAPGESDWTQRSDVTVSYGSSVYTNMYKALQLFEEWLPSKMSQLGFAFDQATVFTGNKLYDGHVDCNGGPCSKSGLGEIEGICQLNAPRAYSVTINRDFGIYSSIQTAAHELGHNLGAQHDGFLFQCSGNDQYIMASAPNVLTASNFNNAFTFSSCSLWHFREALPRIAMKQKENCLLVGTSSPTFIAPPNFATYPGQQYSADQQCQNMYGPSSFYCAGGGSRDQTICQSMECWVPEKRACYVSAEQRAYDGTKCGNHKWCMKGQCESSGSSPATPDTCIYGDYKGQVYVHPEGLMSCYDMGRLRPNTCYLNHTAADCCQTCANIRNNRKQPGCPYGDKHDDHCRAVARKSNCYAASFADTCCDSCNRVKSRRVGCEYGNDADWCSTIMAFNCYQSGKGCCETCHNFYDSRYPGCEYGDRAPWCANQVRLNPETCASESHAKQCCKSCAPYMKTRPEHQVCNDKEPWCSSVAARDCYDYTTTSTCCSTCSRYLRSN